MLIEGPLKIGVMRDENRLGHELHIDFTDEFRGMDLEAQGETFRDYLQLLNAEIPKLDAEDRNRAGMLIVQQIVEQMLPHILAGEMALADTVVVDIGSEAQGLALVDLLN